MLNQLALSKMSTDIGPRATAYLRLSVLRTPMTRDRVKAGCAADHSSGPSYVAKIDGRRRFLSYLASGLLHCSR